MNFHSTIDDARRGVEGFDGCLTMAVTRNPWKRAFSWYTFRKQILRNTLDTLRRFGDHNDCNMGKDIGPLTQEHDRAMEGFNQWLDRYLYQPWDNTWFSLSMPMSQWLGDHVFDLIVDCEEDVEGIFRNRVPRVPMSRAHRLIRKNVSNTDVELYKHVYNQHSRDLIAKVHGTDIERFKYKFT